MIVSEYLDIIKNSEKYVTNSLHLKSSDSLGCVYVWLENVSGFGIRRKTFIALDNPESGISLENKTILTYIEVFPAK